MKRVRPSLARRFYKQPLLENMFCRLDLDQICNRPIKLNEKALRHPETRLHKSFVLVVIG